MDSPSAIYLKQLLAGAALAQPLAAFSSLGLPDKMAAGPAGVAALAAASGTDAGALGRLLRLLAVLGVVEEVAALPDGGKGYQLTAAGRLLREGAPGSLAAMARLAGAPSRAAWLDLADAVRTGRSPVAARFGLPLYPYLGQHPDEAADFHAVQADKAGLLDLAPLCDALLGPGAAALVVDVGGGLGGVLARLLEARPALRGVVLDRPEVAAAAAGFLEGRGLAGRCACQGGDFLVAVPPGGDLYLLCFVAHNGDDAACARLLAACAAAMAPGARLLLVEVMLPGPGEPPAPPAAALLDLEMLVFFDGGRERTAGEYRALLEAAGLRPGPAHPVGPPGSLVAALEAEKPGPDPGPAGAACSGKTPSDRL